VRNEWIEIPLSHGYSENSRGIGVEDMACALLLGRKHRADVDMAYHILDVMQGILDSSKEERPYIVASIC